jgi:2-methylisocitrate lyase-like PEP mutase family enzyme
MNTLNLKARLNEPRLLLAPGCYDALGARLIEAAGFEAAYMTGYGTAAAWGFPDRGLLSATEMESNARRIAEAISIPLIADADTGYGDAPNVARTIRGYEAAGVAAVQLEDQAWPKRCGHMEGKRVVSIDEMVLRIRTAVDARTSENFLVIARTDAIAVEDFERAIDRAQAYAEAGADILFVEAPEDRAQVAEIPRRLPGRKLLLNVAPKTPDLTADEIADLGYALAIYPGLCFMAAWEACRRELETLRTTGSQANLAAWTAQFGDINAFLEQRLNRD